MAKKAAKKSRAKKSVSVIDSMAALTKGQMRKFTALTKSLGEDIAKRAFGEWLSQQSEGGAASADKNATAIVEALQADVMSGRIKIPRGGFIIRRGRGRVIVELPTAT